MTSNTTFANRAGLEFVRSLDELGVTDAGESAEAVGRRAALAVATETIWEDRIGPLLTSSEARALLGEVSRQALSKRVSRRSVIRLTDERGSSRYPAWQFDLIGQRVYPAVPDVIRRFDAAGLDEWAVASFFGTPQPELADRRPADVVAAGLTPELAEASDRAIASLTV